MSASQSEDEVTLCRYAHEFQKASGSREMVEDEEGEWVKYEDVQNLMAFIGGYLLEHRHMLTDNNVHPSIANAVKHIEQRIATISEVRVRD